MGQQTIQDGVSFGTNRAAINSNFTELYTNKADKTAVLLKTNTTPFSPSLDYHPATKKYADDRMAYYWGIYDPQGIQADAFDRANHTGSLAATVITQTASYRFVTDAQMASWDAKEPAITKKTAFNSDFGTGASDTARGNHTHSGVYIPVVAPAVSGNLLSMTAGGAAMDSGYKAADFALAARTTPAGGSARTVLSKTTGTDYDFAWTLPESAYFPQSSSTSNSPLLTGSWAGQLVELHPTADATLTLPETGTEAISSGFCCTVYNGSSLYAITVVGEGTDVLNSPNHALIIPPLSKANIFKVAAGVANEWAVFIQQIWTPGEGSMHQSASQVVNIAAANTWQKVVPASAVFSSDIHLVKQNAGADALQIDYPAAQNGKHVEVLVMVMAAIDISGSSKTVDIAWGTASAVAPSADGFHVTAKNAGAQAVAFTFPFSYVHHDNVNNGDEIFLYIRSTATGNHTVEHFSISVFTQAVIGVEI